MVRIVLFEKQGPMELKVEGQTKAFCQCGLSKKYPFCDGSHTKTSSEEKNNVYQYIDGEPVVVGVMGGCGGDCDCHDDGHHSCACGHDHDDPDDEEVEEKE